MQDKLLRYEIDSWDEVPGCLSNNSKHLHLTYDAVLDKRLTGGIVRVEHDRYGCLFSYLVNGSGPLLSVQEDGTLFELTAEQVLKELEKYGFLVSFAEKYVLDDDQFSLLSTIHDLGVAKVRIMYVNEEKKYLNTYKDSNVLKAYLVAFNAGGLPRWLSNTYTCNEDEFSDALRTGKAFNATNLKGGLQPPHNWSFLADSVLNVTDLLESSR